MTTFGLITEGKTDQIVIENILIGFFNNSDLVINWLLPLRDETDKHRIENYSNWLQVFEYCKSSKFKEAFQFNDYVIVQIDTDTCEDEHYDIPKSRNGQLIDPEELIQQVGEKLKNLIGEEFYDQNENSIIFAIAVHSIECWLLPLLYNDNHKEKVVNCLDTANRALASRGLRIRLQGKKGKYPESYETISVNYCKKKTLLRLRGENPSLKVFVSELERRNIVIE